MVEQTQRHSKVHRKEAEQLRYVNTLLEIGMAPERTRKHVSKVIRRLRTGGLPIIPVSLEQSSTNSHALNGIPCVAFMCAFPCLGGLESPWPDPRGLHPFLLHMSCNLDHSFWNQSQKGNVIQKV
jgi:hypothetical protein